MYTNKDLSSRFGISRESVRMWSNQFAAYLSPSATPEKGRQRNYTDEDLSVFALVDSMRRAGASNEDIAAALGAGQRGHVPDRSLVPRADSSAAALKRHIGQLTLELEDTRRALERSEGKVELLEKQAEGYKTEIRGLYRQLALFEVTQDDE